MPRILPPRPSLQQYRKQARDLARDHRRGDPQACARVERHLPRPARTNGEGGLMLADAQWVVAREHGFASWPRFKHHVEALAAGGAARRRPFVREFHYYEGRASGLHSVRQTGERRALLLIQAFHPAFQERTESEILAAPFSVDDARLVTAREHGFDDWESFRAHVEALASGAAKEPFMAAVDAVKAGDAAGLRSLLRSDRSLRNAPGTNGNRLIHLATSEGRVEIVRLLLEAGADVDLPNNKGWTALHAAAYANPEAKAGVHVTLLRLLLEAGASPELEAYGEGGTPLAVALFWGHRVQADILAERGVLPNNLRCAAGLGRLELARACFRADGSLEPRAAEGREFHRPHGGFPPWSPTESRQEIVDEALVYAAKSGRIELFPFLVEQGADVNGEPYNGTPLMWACTRGGPEAARWLLDHGAEVGRRAAYGGERNLTPLHTAAWGGHAESAALLLERGADPAVPDDNYHSPPWGWAGYNGHAALRDTLARAAARTSLFAAAAIDDLDAARAVLDRDPAQANGGRYWGTPLYLAAQRGNAEMVRLLLERGASPTEAARGDGRSPLELAEAEGREEIASLLRAGRGAAGKGRN